MLLSGITYNAAGQTLAITYGDGTTGTSGDVVSTYAYEDARGWLASVQTRVGTNRVMDLIYARNDAGQITSINSVDYDTRDWTYAYDGVGRLAKAKNLAMTPAAIAAALPDFAYDPADNMVFNSKLCGGGAANPNPNMDYGSQGVSWGRPHGVKTLCGVAVSYNGNGNTMGYDPDGNTGPLAPRTFVYDGENRPVVVLSSHASSTLPTTTVYEYGPDGERTKGIEPSYAAWEAMARR